MSFKLKKTLLALLVVLSMLCNFNIVVAIEDNTEYVNVHITVSDITDYTNPLDVVVPRTQLRVSAFDLSKYGTTLENLNTVSGITYLHALVQLHINLYGEDKVGDNLLLDDTGVTRYFMGRSVANVMYKNGNEIYDLPQDINIEEGDEIQVCLYNRSYSQGIATFSTATVDADVDMPVNLKLYEHFESPRDRQPLDGAEIIDSSGLYILDDSGNIVETSKDGSFTVKFSDPGTYYIAAMPEINYYMEPSDGGTTTVWETVTSVITEQVTKYKLTGKKAVTSNKEIQDSIYNGTISPNFAIVYTWEDYDENLIPDDKDVGTYYLTKNSDGTVSLEGYDPVVQESYETQYITKTELVEKEVPSEDKLLPAVTYTIPFCVVNVTADFSADEPSSFFLQDSDYDAFDIVLHNSQKLDPNSCVAVAAYTNNKLINIDVREKEEVIGKTALHFSFGKGADTYKVFFWDGIDSMKPIYRSFKGVSTAS